MTPKTRGGVKMGRRGQLGGFKADMVTSQMTDNKGVATNNKQPSSSRQGVRNYCYDASQGLI